MITQKTLSGVIRYWYDPAFCNSSNITHYIDFVHWCFDKILFEWLAISKEKYGHKLFKTCKMHISQVSKDVSVVKSIFWLVTALSVDKLLSIFKTMTFNKYQKKASLFLCKHQKNELRNFGNVYQFSYIRIRII